CRQSHTAVEFRCASSANSVIAPPSRAMSEVEAPIEGFNLDLAFGAHSCVYAQCWAALAAGPPCWRSHALHPPAFWTTLDDLGRLATISKIPDSIEVWTAWAAWAASLFSKRGIINRVTEQCRLHAS